MVAHMLRYVGSLNVGSLGLIDCVWIHDILWSYPYLPVDHRDCRLFKALNISTRAGCAG